MQPRAVNKHQIIQFITMHNVANQFSKLIVRTGFKRKSKDDLFREGEMFASNEDLL